MATITRRQSTKPGARSATYQAKIRSLDACISRSFARKDDALTWATLVEANLRSGKPAEQDIPAALQKVRKSALTEASPVTPGTVADLIKRYEKRVLPNKKPSTQRSQKEQDQGGSHRWVSSDRAGARQAVPPHRIASFPSDQCRKHLRPEWAIVMPY